MTRIKKCQRYHKECKMSKITLKSVRNATKEMGMTLKMSKSMKMCQNMKQNQEKIAFP